MASRMRVTSLMDEAQPYQALAITAKSIHTVVHRRVHLDTASGARDVPARSTSAGLSGLAKSRLAFALEAAAGRDVPRSAACRTSINIFGPKVSTASHCEVDTHPRFEK